MKLMLTGAAGLVGHALAQSLQSVGEVIALQRAQMDLGDLDGVRALIRAVRPDIIVNAAAYTDVERAEEARELAFLINARAPAVMAEEAAKLGAAIVHLSTDYVFDGEKAGPYDENDRPAPLNIYGASKLAGEIAVAESGAAHLIFRSSWIYGTRGRNFLLTILRLARERPHLQVVADQIGAPTWNCTVAEVVAALLGQARDAGAPWWQRHGGLYHLSAQGQTSWHGFADAIVGAARLSCSIDPISSDKYPAKARRPANSLLDCSKLRARFGELPQWETDLAKCMAQIPRQAGE